MWAATFQTTSDRYTLLIQSNLVVQIVLDKLDLRLPVLPIKSLPCFAGADIFGDLCSTTASQHHPILGRLTYGRG